MPLLYDPHTQNVSAPFDGYTLTKGITTRAKQAQHVYAFGMILKHCHMFYYANKMKSQSTGRHNYKFQSVT